MHPAGIYALAHFVIWFTGSLNLRSLEHDIGLLLQVYNFSSTLCKKDSSSLPSRSTCLKSFETAFWQASQCRLANIHFYIRIITCSDVNNVLTYFHVKHWVSMTWYMFQLIGYRLVTNLIKYMTNLNNISLSCRRWLASPRSPMPNRWNRLNWQSRPQAEIRVFPVWQMPS